MTLPASPAVLSPAVQSAAVAPAMAAAIAAHRFGLGEPSLATVGRDATGWLLAQLGPADTPLGTGLPDTRQAVQQVAEYQRRLLQARRVQPGGTAGAMPAAMAGEMPGELAMAGVAQAQVPGPAPSADMLRSIAQADARSRLATAASSARPLAERLVLFWANHFTVSLAKASTRGLAGAFEREAIRPHIAGRFETLLAAAVKHPAMLRYLDNDRSAGPQSRVVQRLARLDRGDGQGPRVSGLNENLAREVLELHTLGAASANVPGGYTQADVTEFARVLTGWRVPLRTQGWADGPAAAFDPAWHDPGPKTVLGQRLREGPQALDEVLHHLARHPATARTVATKLVRHLVADDPPPALVERLVARYQQTEGDLTAVVRTLLESPEAWAPAPAKLKTPEEFVLSSARVLGLGAQAFERQPDGAIVTLGQRVLAAPSPAGWPDRAEDWLGPDAVWKRVEWATRVGDRLGRRVDARALARESLGARLGEDTARAIERAADGPQALALLLLAPEFQRR